MCLLSRTAAMRAELLSSSSTGTTRPGKVWVVRDNDMQSGEVTGPLLSQGKHEGSLNVDQET
jgi:hypothetical protein